MCGNVVHVWNSAHLCHLCVKNYFSFSAAKGKYQLIWESLKRTDDQASYMPSEDFENDVLLKVFIYPKTLSAFVSQFFLHFCGNILI